MIQQTQIRFELSQGWGDFKLLWLMKYELGKSYNGYLHEGDLKWEEVKEGEFYEKLKPFMKINERFFPVQEMINALTNTKKATEQVETLSELKATKYHLEDMRKIALKL
jgi:hypothetical protein